MAYMKICPNCSLPCSADTLICNCGTSLITISPVQIPEPGPEAIVATIREEVEQSSASVTPTIRDISVSIPSVTTREQPASDRGSLIRLPSALADRYQLEHELPARGNEADLLSALDRIDNHRVVIKLYRTGIEPKEEVLRLISGLDGRYVIRQLTHGNSDGRFYEVMEFASGGSFADLLRVHQGSLKKAELIQMVTQISAALDYLHNLTPQLVHRDVKPDNVLVRRVDPLELVLTDFGIASIVEGGSRIAGSVHRTILYAAPEAIVGDISPAMDWWSLGMMVAEAAVGRHPFSGISDQAIAIHCSNRRPIPLEEVADPRVRLLCQGLLGYDQKQRWSMKEVSKWLHGDKTLRPPIETSSHLTINRTEGAEIRASRPYRIGDRECWTARELAVAMCENWDDAIKRVGRRADLERWLMNDLNDQNILNTLLDITEIPDITPEISLITFLQMLIPESIPSGAQISGLGPDILKICLQATVGVTVAERRLGEILMSGNELPANYIEAERLFRMAASKGDEDAIREVKEIERFIKIRRDAKTGNPIAQFSLFMKYKDGKGVAKDKTEAVKWLQKAAEQGHADAQYILGMIYKNRRVSIDDMVQAINWLQKAAILGHSNAQKNLGLIYKNGEGVVKNEIEASKWFQKSAETGDATAQYNLGLMYAEGHGVTKDYDEAVRWYQKAAKQGQVDAQYRLGVMYDDGQGVKKDYTEALKWYVIAVNQDHPCSQYKLGIMYYNGSGVVQDKAKGMSLIIKAAYQGNADAQCFLGIDNFGDEEAFKWFQKAADKGHAEAQYWLGSCYRSGLGVRQDTAEAAKWYKKAAEQGNADAQNNLGVSYKNRHGVSKNDAEAFKWFHKAALQGHEDAKINLGCMYLIGCVVDKNPDDALKWLPKDATTNADCQNRIGNIFSSWGNDCNAVKWFKKAAEQGHIGAQHSLGCIYSHGSYLADALETIPRNDAEAVKWFQKATDQGYSNAEYALETMRQEGRYTPLQDQKDIPKHNTERKSWLSRLFFMTRKNDS